MNFFCNKKIKFIKNNRLQNEIKYDINKNNNKFNKMICNYYSKSNNDIIVIKINNLYFKIIFSEAYPLLPPEIIFNNKNYIDVIDNLNNNSNIIKFESIIDDWYPNFKIYNIIDDIHDQINKIDKKHKILYLDKVIKKHVYNDLKNNIFSFFL
jgi:ubiquitin-protein ligase|tara:strand:- start:8 stop:466 length:459 start_codon:yes stop_codon:yes gene_type:complete